MRGTHDECLLSQSRSRLPSLKSNLLARANGPPMGTVSLLGGFLATLVTKKFQFESSEAMLKQ